MIAEVAFNLPLERAFHYLVPPAAQASLQPGMRVAAPFGPRERVGMVLQLLEASPIPASRLKPLRRVLDPAPVIAEERWALAQWMARYYCCSLGEALAAMVPAQLRVKKSEAPLAGAVVPEGANGITLSADQDRALRILTRLLRGGRARTVLLNGVTGSGKTELYLRAISQVLAQGRSAICLIPEIALTPQAVDRFTRRFPGQVVVWHSGLTASQRAAAWTAALRGACRIVVGARSAVFAPVRRLGLIIVDEEHEPTYKQEGVPRYHARDVARARAGLAGAVVVLGTATPSIESFYAARQGRDRLVPLPARVGGRAMPAVEIVDMREELAMRRRAGPLSSRLRRALEQAVERGEQALLLLNRRGFARVAQCQACGAVSRCARCSVPLVYHAGLRALLCHYCNFQQPPPDVCAECRKGYVKLRGAGTERVESELHRLFPLAAIGRMDRDTTRRPESHQAFYDAMRNRELGLLVGTQMIAKGHDFPQVTLVGVVSADTALNLPDFRAGERTFDLLTQMAGRAGRGEQPGRVLVQTFCPEHYAIRAAQHHDYRRFYEEEIRMRRQLRLPPFVHLVELTLLGQTLARVQEAARALADRLRHAGRASRITVLGPAPHRVARLRRTYRVCLVLKHRDAGPMVALVRRVLEPGRKFRGLPVLVDVDPV